MVQGMTLFLSSIFASFCSHCMASDHSFCHYFIYFFTALSPLAIVVLYVSMTPDRVLEERLNAAKIACLIAWVMLLSVLFGGPGLLQIMGIAMEAFYIGSGLLLVVVGFSMLRAKDPEVATKDRVSPNRSGKGGRWDISIVPLSVPIIAGPGIMGKILSTRMILDGTVDYLACLGAVSAIILLLYVFHFAVAQCVHLLPPLILRLIFRLSGLFLVAMGIQFVMNGYRETELYAHTSPASYIVSRL
jgi:multiple antibiotic resistance protein